MAESPAITTDEASRLNALRECVLPRGAPSDGLDEIVRDAARVCDAAIAMINLVDAHELRIEAAVGWSPATIAREQSICSQTIAGDGLLVVPDTRADARFATRWFVTADPYVRFYAGVPLLLADGGAIGTLCVLDLEPRVLRADAHRAVCGSARAK